MKGLLVLVLLNMLTAALSRSITVNTSDWRSHPNWKLLNNEQCGMTYEDRVVNGRNAHVGEFPWMAAIFGRLKLVPWEFTDVYVCGGSLINERYVITAAHCLYLSADVREIGEIYAVWLGEVSLNKTSDSCEHGICPEGQFIPIESYKLHPELGTPKVMSNDIGLIRLAKAAKLNEWVNTICLFPYNVNLVGDLVFIAGWGLTGNNSRASKLQVITSKIVNLTKCQEIVGFQEATIDEKNLCVVSTDESSDTCKGDSGSPAMTIQILDDDKPRYYLGGTLSFGTTKCAYNWTPSVYINVWAYMDFILNNIY